MLVALGALVVILPTKTEKTSRLASEGSIDSFAGSFRKTHSEGTIPRHNRYEEGGGVVLAAAYEIRKGTGTRQSLCRSSAFGPHFTQPPEVNRAPVSLIFFVISHFYYSGFRLRFLFLFLFFLCRDVLHMRCARSV